MVRNLRAGVAERFHELPTLWFFITIAPVTEVAGGVLIDARLAPVQRGRAVDAGEAVCAAGRLALM